MYSHDELTSLNLRLLYNQIVSFEEDETNEFKEVRGGNPVRTITDTALGYNPDT